MSEAWKRIVSQSPFSGQRQAQARPDTAEVEMALLECEQKGVTDRDSGRVVAYAWYSGFENDRVLKLVRAAGARNVLLRELSCYKLEGERKVSELIALLVHRGSTFNLAQCLDNPAIGWAVAVMTVVEAADFGALVSSLDSPEDELGLICLFLLLTFVPPASRVALVKKLAAVSGDFFEEILIALACGWIEDAVLLEGQPIDAVLSEIESSGANRVAVVGAMFDHVLLRFGHARLAGAADERLQRAWDSINGTGKRVIQQAANIEAVLRRAGRRDLEVLEAMSQWRNDAEMSPATAAYMGKRATDFLQRSFGSAMYEREGAGADLVFSERIINPLIHALRFDGIEVSLFVKLHERLASDAFSRMTRYATWLNDRRRAIALVVIAGLVAKGRGDLALLSAVEQASAELLSQPSGFQPVLNAAAAAQVAAELGFTVPAA